MIRKGNEPLKHTSLKMPSLDSKDAAPNAPIKCIYWNVRSISGKKNVKHLQHYITKKQVDLLFLSETWQRKGHHLPELLGYNLISCMSDHAGGRGGVACYFKQEHSPYISSYKNDPQGHYLWLKLDKALGFEKDLFAAVCYFPPTASTAYKGRERLEPNFPYTNLSNDIFSFSTKKSVRDFFVVGDFNSRIGDAQAPEAHRHGLSRESADKKINKFGLPLMDVCDKNDLIICNGVTQVWPKSGETTCRSKSVVDYILAPVSRARYLVKDIEILPLEKKSDHNAMNFTLRRPRPLHDLPSPEEVAKASAAASSTNTSIEKELRRPLSEILNKSPTEAPNQTISGQCATTAQKALKSDTKKSSSSPPEVVIDANKMGCTGPERGGQNSPKSVIMSSDEWESTSSRERPHEETGTSFLSYERELPEQGSNRLTTSLHEVTTSDTQAPNLSETEVTRPVKCEPYTPPPGFNAAAWFEAKTSRLLNKILAAGLSQQDPRHRKPAPIVGHPIFPNYKKGYMTKNLDALTKQLNHKHNPNSNKLDARLGGLGSTEYWSRKVEEASITEPVFLLDKRVCPELMTINSRPASVASPGLVHVARLYVRADTSCRGQSNDGSRMTTSGSWGAKGLKMGPGFRCTCMCPGHGHSRELQINFPFKSDTFTKAITVVEPSKFSILLKNLKSAYDSGKLWKSITQFKITRKIVKAIR